MSAFASRLDKGQEPHKRHHRTDLEVLAAAAELAVGLAAAADTEPVEVGWTEPVSGP